jgi:type I restriction enzyme, S subunit
MKWPLKKAKDLCILAVDCVNRTAPTVEYETPYKMIRTTNVKAGFVYLDEVRYVTEETFNEWTRRSRPIFGDVVLTREAPLGEVGRFTASDENVFLGQRLFHYRPNPALLDWNYLAYILQSREIQGKILGMGFGATVEHIKVGDAENLEIPYPPIAVQRRIGETLSAYDDLIENNRRRIQLLEQSARLLYKEWFVQFRFPGHEHVKISAGVPEGWAKTPLGEIAPLNYGKALKAESRVPGIVPVYGSSGIVGSHDKPLASGPAIVVGRKGNVGSVFWSPVDFYPIDTVYFVENSESSAFLFHSLQSMTFISTDVAVPGLNRDFAHSRLVLLPPKLLFELFEEAVQPLMKQVTMLERYSAKLTQARDLLLPRLMSGALVA